MNKSIYIKALVITAFGFFFTSCDQDQSVPDIPRDNSTPATVKESSITVTEGGNASFTIVQEELIEPKEDDLELGGFRSGQIGVRVIGGTATEGVDYTFNIDLIPDVSSFLFQGGRYYDYDASVSLEHVVNNILTIVSDGTTEGAETIELQFFPVGLGAVVIDDTLTITIND